MRNEMGLNCPLKGFAISTDKLTYCFLVADAWTKEVLYCRTLQLNSNRNAVDGHGHLQRVPLAAKNSGVAKRELHENFMGHLCQAHMPRLNLLGRFD